MKPIPIPRPSPPSNLRPLCVEVSLTSYAVLSSATQGSNQGKVIGEQSQLFSPV
jgi:hypothetical protein